MSETDACLFYNPRCSKCRDALKLLTENGCSVEIIEYLKTPPTKAQLQAVLSKLGMAPSDLVRKGEAIYAERYAGRTLTDEQWLDAMVEHPILIERPIFVRGDLAVVGRPPERVLELLPPHRA